MLREKREEMREGRAVIDVQGDVAIFTLFVSRDAPACAVPAPALLNPFFFSRQHQVLLL